ncbi:MAG: hypothetical protein ACRBCJ_11745 [Hyphomicrobiaceae bacterium]
MARKFFRSADRAPKPAAVRAADPTAKRCAPDPFSAVLPAIAGLGAISSVASVNWGSGSEDVSRTRSRRKAGRALRDLENNCLGLHEVFRRFLRYPDVFGGARGSAASPLKFGVHGPRLAAEEIRAYQQVMNDMASLLVQTTQNVFDVMGGIEDGSITAPEEVFFAFGEAQDRLNRVIQDRATLGEAVKIGEEVALELTELIRKLQAHMME